MLWGCFQELPVLVFVVPRSGEQNPIKNKEDDDMCCFDEKTSDAKKSAMGEGQKEKMWEKMMDCCFSSSVISEQQKWMDHIPLCGPSIFAVRI